jgi:hypothetical protein
MWFISGRFAPLLVALLGVIVGAPVTLGIDIPFLRLLFTLLFFAALFALSHSRRILTIALVIAVPSVVTSWAGLLAPGMTVDLVHLGFEAAFMLYTAAAVMARVLEEKKVSADTIYGGICVYLLIALTFSSLYRLVEVLEPGSLVIAGVPLGDRYPNPSQLWDAPETFYFSFVTITTLGYGDVVPASSPARSLAIVEAVIGQLFIAVFMARLVGLHLARPRSD